MRVTDISMTKKGRYALSVDGQFLFSLHEEMMAASHLKVGDEVTVERLEELRQQSELKITKERALRLLSAKSYTAAQLQEKLERYADPQSAAQTVERMEELGFVNDEDYAYVCARDLFTLKGYSRQRIRQELRRRGIEDWLAEEAAAQIDEEESDQRLLALVRRKYARGLEEQKGKARAVNGLSRLGYSYDAIRSAIAQVIEENQLEEE